MKKIVKPIKYIVITREHPHVNFGQIVKFQGYNEITEEIYVIPEGEKYEVATHFSEIFPCEDMNNYAKLNKSMEELLS